MQSPIFSFAGVGDAITAVEEAHYRWVAARCLERRRVPVLGQQRGADVGIQRRVPACLRVGPVLHTAEPLAEPQVEPLVGPPRPCAGEKGAQGWLAGPNQGDVQEMTVKAAHMGGHPLGRHPVPAVLHLAVCTTPRQ
jgi:hypothetical protein